MKSILFIFCLFLLSLISCGKDNSINPYKIQYSGSASILKNDLVWTPKIVALSSSGNKDLYVLQLVILDEHEYPSQILTIGSLPVNEKSGKYTITKYNQDRYNITSNFATMRYDILDDYFEADTSDISYINIVENANTFIRGNFEIFLPRSPLSKRKTEKSDTLVFRCINFSTRIHFVKQ